MPVQGNLTLNTKVYAPRGKTGDVASWALVGDTSFGGATSIITESVRGPDRKSGVSRVQWRFQVPKAATTDSACACVGSELGRATANIDVVIGSVLTPAERTDLTLRLQALVANAVFRASVESMEGSW